MRREYQFDYRQSRPSRFASLMKGGTVAVVLDPDVASVFRSPESVNALLRSVINALPKNAKAQLKSGSLPASAAVARRRRFRPRPTRTGFIPVSLSKGWILAA